MLVEIEANYFPENDENGWKTNPFIYIPSFRSGQSNPLHHFNEATLAINQNFLIFDEEIDFFSI